jgi:large subunit ribosomal protein L19e
MNLKKKKAMASRLLKVGKERIVFVRSRTEDIKEAITKQDIRDLVTDKAIIIKGAKGRKSTKRKTNRSTGNIRKKINKRKQNYVKLTRKLRGYIQELKKQGTLTKEEVEDIRKRIRNSEFRSKANLKEYIGGLKR